MKRMPKRIWLLLTVIVLVAGLLGMTAFAANIDPIDEPVCYDHGDVNSDGAITGEDAVYLLFASFGDLFGDEYLLSQDGDLDGDGAVTGDDAVYLLFASFGDLFGDQYPLNGTIHSYFDPIWTWDTDAAVPTAQVSLKCACGENHTITEGITITAGTVVEPTCVASGSKEYTGSMTFDSSTYENTVTVTVPALGENGHTMVGEPTCENGVKCQNCDYTIEALGHSYVDNGEKVEGCKHTELYKCACGSEVEGDVYYTHTYAAELLEEATCTKAGKKLLTCSCGDTQEEVVPINPEFHVWGDAVTENGVTTQTCACGETKTIVVMSDSGVSADALKDSEVQLEGGTSVALDENTAEQLDAEKSVVIKVEQIDKDQTGMSDAEKEQVGDNAIYDFSMQYDDGTPITSFSGEVTVSLPYTLQEGDDVNAIDVWFIADDGSVECVKGVYSNNYVTFKTNHFSYYTVTRLTPEQRCAVYGHTIVERTKDATCTEDGYHKVFCQRCGLEEKNEVKAMLGHDYRKNDEQSEDATCNAPGKLATQCANCGHKRLQEVKQLSHQWSIETVAPSCSGKGYDRRTCSLCGTEKIDNEKEALGHSYSKDSAVWSWSEDHSKATVTLTCANDKTHTKELNAVVTSDGGNACVGGEVTYTATASFNKITYTETAIGELEGIGHTPASQWESNNEKHYHICSVCGEPVGAAEHDWKREVIKAATCGNDGSATDTCSVCGKENSVVLPATGDHTYKNGVCSSCGYVEGSCDHEKRTSVEIDLTEYGVCGGTLTLRVCECGKIKQWNGVDLVCEIVDDEEEINEEGGYIHYAAGCSVCGLRLSLDQRRILDKESCSGYWVLVYTVTVNNTVVIETYEETEPTEHPVTVYHDPVNLADYGLCAQTVTNSTCSCGLRSYWDFEGEGCDYSYDEAGKNFTCTTCGATGTISSTRSSEGCQTVIETVVTYYKNGSKVFAYTERVIQINHDYELVNYEMNGDFCKDGVSIFYVCATCGDTDNHFYASCSPVLVDRVIDTSATNSCTPGIEIRSCPCGGSSDWHYLYDDEDTDHQWDYEYDEKNDTWIEYCIICNFSLSVESEKLDTSKKDENCQVSRKLSYTYTNGEENGFFTWDINEITTHHTNIYTYELAGESCEDGVSIHRVCSDCGSEEDWIEYYHSMFAQEKLDISKYGPCTGTVSLYVCACEQYSEVYEEFDNCQLEPIAGDEGLEEWRCINCGIIRQTRWEEQESDEPCTYVTSYEYTYLKDGETLGVFEFARQEERHRFIYELSLNDGAETCEDGFIAKGICLDCEYTQEYEERGCWTHVVSRQLVSVDGMCGEMEIVTQRCACGKYSDNGIRWTGDTSCEFYSGDQVYNEEYQAWQYFCVCGASRIYRSNQFAVEGEPCQVEIQSTQRYFAPNGELIAEVFNSNINEDHDFLFRYDLLGETCEDGWTYSRACADCGLTDTYGDVLYGCSGNFVSRELVFSSEEICGPVYLYHASCACGKLSSYDVSTYCSGSWINGLFTCDTCGLQHKNLYNHVKRPGTCLEDVTMTYTFMLDGETVGAVSKTYVENNHVAVYQLILLGETCEDGYRTIECCAFCDYEHVWEDISYGHETYRTEYYEAPEGSCGGYITVAACACGRERSVWENLYCNMSGYEDSETDENGVVHYVRTGECINCDMAYRREWYDTPGADDCHKVNNVAWSFYFDEVTLNLSEHYISEEHDFEITDAVLEVEGSTDCSDGVWITARCTRCGEENSWGTTAHTTVVDEAKTIDLSAYGSVCGAKLELRSCACGRLNNYVFSDDTQCDVGSNEIPNWIDGALDDSFFTTNGWNNVYSYAYERYCAVTDPACGLRIRMATYWINENCTAVQYETWQLGYDPETGTCQKEVTVATGDTKTYHAYEDEPYVETNVDGITTWLYKYACPDCGSYYTDTYCFDENHFQFKYAREAVNTLNNGEDKRVAEIREYQNMGDSISYTKLERYEYVYADGATYWVQHEYTYDIDNGCVRTDTYTNSYGERYVTEDAGYHYTQYTNELTQAPTCTQFGTCVERWVCELCGEITRERIADVYPSDHSWYYDAEKQISFCSVCGLESQNGISGSIWLEDMSNEGNYIVGYYCEKDIPFSPYVSLILYDAADGENDELVLDSVVVNYLTVEKDGICGLSFSKTETAAAAASALQAAGYTGRYAVRISCVPLGSTDTLDYAVTFETLTAE